MGDYYGQRTSSIENQFLHVEFLLDAGPRIVRVILAGSKDNLLAELPNEKKQTPFGDFHFYGGHRLWAAPETFPQSYVPDDHPINVNEIDGGVRLCGATEQQTGITKCIDIRLGEH